MWNNNNYYCAFSILSAWPSIVKIYFVNEISVFLYQSTHVNSWAWKMFTDKFKTLEYFLRTCIFPKYFTHFVTARISILLIIKKTDLTEKFLNVKRNTDQILQMLQSINNRTHCFLLFIHGNKCWTMLAYKGHFNAQSISSWMNDTGMQLLSFLPHLFSFFYIILIFYSISKLRKKSEYYSSASIAATIFLGYPW